MKKFILYLLVFVMIFSVVLADTPDMSEVENQMEYFRLMREFIKESYNFEVTDEQMLEGAVRRILAERPELYEEILKGCFDSLDAHSVYFTADEYSSFEEFADPKFTGIGVSILKKQEYIVIVGVFENSPAAIAGLKAGDKFIAVDGEDVVGMDTEHIIPKVRGEANTFVNITVSRNGQILDFIVKRDIIIVSPIEYKKLENNIGYIKLESFNEYTGLYLEDALKFFDGENITDIIFDLRNNPGGTISALVEAANFFIKAGPVIRVVSTSGEEFVEESTNQGLKYNLAVLINEGSASAAEAFSAAVKDTGSGVLIGVNTFGKGTVQHVYPLAIDGAIKLTVANYYSPLGNVIDEVGVAPDIFVKNKTRSVDMSTITTYATDSKPKIGDVSLDVLALEERLKIIGFDIEPDEIFDSRTEEFVSDFQSFRGLHPYGVFDTNTRISLELFLQDFEIVEDTQLETAIEYLSNDN